MHCETGIFLIPTRACSAMLCNAEGGCDVNEKPLHVWLTGSPLCMDQQLCRPQQLQSVLPLRSVCSRCKFTVHGKLPPSLVSWRLLGGVVGSLH